MKGNRFSIVAAAVMAFTAFVSCTQKEDKVQTGDLLFVGIPMDYSIEDGSMSEAIASSTGNGSVNYIHTAILEVDEAGIWVIDATIKHGVDRHPLDTFKVDFTLKDGSLPVLEVYRLNDNSNAALYVENAKKFLGEEYDVYFKAGNDKHYCTELVYDSYIEEGEHIFTANPMNFKNADGEFPLYWQQLFSLIGESIPQDEPGTNPQAIHAESCIHKLNITL